MPLASGASWPGPITVTVTAGYGDAGSDVPGDLRLAMRIAIAAMYDNRGMLPEDFWDSLDYLLCSYRRPAIA